MPARDRTLAAIEGIRFARGYMRLFLEDLTPEDWFWQPGEGVTHIAWQVGHSAVAEYSLALRRIRGEQADDESLVSTDCRQRFGKGSTPAAGADTNPPPDEIRATFDRVHDAVLQTLEDYSDEQLDVPSEPRHPAFTTKLGSLIWCGRHEMTHAGQIALLRRLMGKPPLR